MWHEQPTRGVVEPQADGQAIVFNHSSLSYNNKVGNGSGRCIFCRVLVKRIPVLRLNAPPYARVRLLFESNAHATP